MQLTDGAIAACGAIAIIVALLSTARGVQWAAAKTSAPHIAAVAADAARPTLSAWHVAGGRTATAAARAWPTGLAAVSHTSRRRRSTGQQDRCRCYRYRCWSVQGDHQQQNHQSMHGNCHRGADGVGPRKGPVGSQLARPWPSHKPGLAYSTAESSTAAAAPYVYTRSQLSSSTWYFPLC